MCPFTGTAIGENNIRFFYCFVVCVQVLVYVAIGVAGYGLWVIAQEGYTPPF